MSEFPEYSETATYWLVLISVTLVCACAVAEASTKAMPTNIKKA